MPTPAAELPLLASRRSEIHLIHAVLSHAEAGGKRSHIMMGARLTTASLQTYLDGLLARGFVERARDGHYHLTTAGRALKEDVERVLRHFI